MVKTLCLAVLSVAKGDLKGVGWAHVSGPFYPLVSCLNWWCTHSHCGVKYSLSLSDCFVFDGADVSTVQWDLQLGRHKTLQPLCYVAYITRVLFIHILTRTALVQVGNVVNVAWGQLIHIQPWTGHINLASTQASTTLNRCENVSIDVFAQNWK